MPDLDATRVAGTHARIRDLAPPGEHRTVTVLDLGPYPYRDAFELQNRLQADRIDGRIRDLLLTVEHNPVYTYGKRTDLSHLVLDEAQLRERGIDLVPVDRGGDITYHGPGQLVAYPILFLGHYKRDLHDYMRRLEETIIRLLATFGLEGVRREGMTGVWVPDPTLGRIAKICAMGVRVSRWVTKHGLALNLQQDLAAFTGIVPCGLHGEAVTSLAKLVDPSPERAEVVTRLHAAFAGVFNATVVAREIE